jgi:hypothetical protein
MTDEQKEFFENLKNQYISDIDNSRLGFVYNIRNSFGDELMNVKVTIKWTNYNLPKSHERRKAAGYYYGSEVLHFIEKGVWDIVSGWDADELERIMSIK